MSSKKKVTKKSKKTLTTKALPVKKTTSSKQLMNHFMICLDSSGSMRSIKRAAIEAFNKNVLAIIDGALKAGQKATVSLTTFGEGQGDVREKFFAADMSSLASLSESTYLPSGMTPMLDAIGTSTERLKDLPDNKETSYVVIVVTDGFENASKIYTQDTLRNLMCDSEKTDRWTFAFLVPPGNKFELCNKLKISDGNVQEWEATASGMQAAATSVNTAVSSYYTLRASGKTSTKGFFVTDMSKVTTKEVQQKLHNVRSSVHVWPVLNQAVIKDFVQAQGVQYEKGKAFYQLTKDEVVQGYKQIALVEKGKQAVYVGSDARNILGLPSTEVKVRPGNHNNWDIFVQSTSLNRKLVGGTNLLYVK